MVHRTADSVRALVDWTVDWTTGPVGSGELSKPAHSKSRPQRQEELGGGKRVEESVMRKMGREVEGASSLGEIHW